MRYDAAMLTCFSMAPISVARFSGAVRARSTTRRLPHLWLMTDSDRLADPIGAVRRLPPGCAVIVRHRDATERARLAHALMPLCRARRLKLLIAGDWQLAAAIGADGVHLSEAMARRGCAAGLRLWRRKRLLTVSNHGAGAWPRVPCDAVILGAVLPTASHPDRRSLGRVRTALLMRRGPTIVLGGISARTLTQLNGMRLAGIAGIGFAESAQNLS